MKHIHSKFFKKIMTCLFVLFSACSSLSASAATQHYFIRPLRTGDTVYFDNWDANWGEIRIYMYNSSTDSSEIAWEDRPFMTYDSGSIYKYTITADMNIEQYGYDYIIFTDNTNQQTIDLGFVGNGYAYKVDAWQGDKRSGYWYLYDQSDVTIEYVQPISASDEIYFDNSGTDWDNVRIYLFSTIDGGSERFAWNDRPAMEPIGDNIYKFVAASDLNIDQYKDNHIIFTNSSDAQTIDLGFIDSGYAYKVESWENGRAVGYWYVYDKASLIDAVAAAEAYLAKLDCLPDAKTSSLKWAIEYAKIAISSEIPVETEVVGNVEEYWNQVTTEESHLSSIMQTMVGLYGESPTVCEDVPDPDDPDIPDIPEDPDGEEDASSEDSSQSIDATDDQAIDNDSPYVPDTGAGPFGSTGANTAIGVSIFLSIVIATTGLILVKTKKQ